MSDSDVYPALVVNPEAVGDPTQTPIVQLSPAMAAFIRGERDDVKIDGNGRCCSCGREAPPDVERVAESLARAEGTRMEWVGYDAQERYRELARAALEVIQ